MEDKLNQIKSGYLTKIQQADSSKKLDEIFLALFGKNGEITLLPKDFSKLSREELTKVGPLFNQVKQELEKQIQDSRFKIQEENYRQLNNELFTLQPASRQGGPPGLTIKKREGHIHPLTKFENEIVELFGKLGFQQFDAPQIDTDYYNFEVLNIPQGHPARDLWDTFYIAESGKRKAESKLLLRTHTSNSQYRIMTNHKPPIRMMVLGRCYRYENVDARHEHTFDQFELVYIDKGLSMANLQYLSEYFLKSVIDPDIKVRLRPKYYPFVEPGVGIDGVCMFCKGKARLPDGQGCKVCGGIGWLELGGAGMIHPTVLKNAGIDPKEYSGIAWGPGLERILMLKHAVNDLRLFRSGDLKFLQNIK